MSVELNVDERNANLTLFSKVDYRVKALELAVSLHEPVRCDGQQNVDAIAAQVLALADRFLEHFRATNRHC